MKSNLKVQSACVVTEFIAVKQAEGHVLLKPAISYPTNTEETVKLLKRKAPFYM